MRAFTVAAGLFCAVFLLSAFALQGQDLPLSPRLVDLQKELRAGNRAALEDFWKEVIKQGAPVVEPVQGDSQYVVVTFLWRAKVSGGHDYFPWQATLADGVLALIGKDKVAK